MTYDEARLLLFFCAVIFLYFAVRDKLKLMMEAKE